MPSPATCPIAQYQHAAESRHADVQLARRRCPPSTTPSAFKKGDTEIGLLTPSPRPLKAALRGRHGQSYSCATSTRSYGLSLRQLAAQANRSIQANDPRSSAQGFLVSLQLFVLTLLGSIPLGIPVAFMRMSKIVPLRWIGAHLHFSVMRGTPLMLQMFAIYFAPYYVFGISLTARFQVDGVRRGVHHQLRRLLCRDLSLGPAVHSARPIRGSRRCWATRACRRFCIS